MATLAAIQRARTTAKTRLTKSINKMTKAIQENKSIRFIAELFADVEKSWTDVNARHEEFVNQVTVSITEEEELQQSLQEAEEWLEASESSYDYAREMWLDFRAAIEDKVTKEENRREVDSIKAIVELEVDGLNQSAYLLQELLHAEEQQPQATLHQIAHLVNQVQLAV